MNKKLNLKDKKVDIYSVDTGRYEKEIMSYLDRGMVVVFHSASFNNKNVVWLGVPGQQTKGSITVNGYRPKTSGEKVSLIIS